MATVTIRPAVDATELPVVDTLEGTESDVTAAQAADVFPQSVASGGPTPTGIILWTRINPEQYDPSQSLRVEVATDKSFEDLVIRSELPDPGVKPTDNYTLRVDLDGLLDPDTARHAGKLFNDDNFEEALVALDEDEEERKKAQEHPKQYLRDKGVQIPGNPEVGVIPDNWSISICWKDICAKISF